jgi:hypothetical protein
MSTPANIDFRVFDGEVIDLERGRRPEPVTARVDGWQPGPVQRSEERAWRSKGQVLRPAFPLRGPLLVLSLAFFVALAAVLLVTGVPGVMVGGLGQRVGEGFPLAMSATQPHCWHTATTPPSSALTSTPQTPAERGDAPAGPAGVGGQAEAANGQLGQRGR